MADPKSGATNCERPDRDRPGGVCWRLPSVGQSPYPEDHVRWVRICRRCLAEWDASVEADRVMLVERDRWAAWKTQAEALADG